MHVVAQHNDLFERCHRAAVAAGWWRNLQTGEPKERNRGEALCLIHSEISEAYQAFLMISMDEKLPHHRGVAVELADTLIRIADYAGGFGYEIPAFEWARAKAVLEARAHPAPHFCDLHATVSELMEHERKQYPQNARQNRLYDLILITMVLCIALDIDVGPIIEEKLAYNAQRADHKPEARLAAGGKSF